MEKYIDNEKYERGDAPKYIDKLNTLSVDGFCTGSNVYS